MNKIVLGCCGIWWWVVGGCACVACFRLLELFVVSISNGMVQATKFVLNVCSIKIIEKYFGDIITICARRGTIFCVQKFILLMECIFNLPYIFYNVEELC